MLYLRGMIQEEFGCDYPGCCEHFDQSGGEVAILKDGQVQAFCVEHARLLKNKGVPLQTISAVNDERRHNKAVLDAVVKNLKGY